MASITELLHSEQAKSQCCPVEPNNGVQAQRELQKAINVAGTAQLAHTVDSLITDSMIANTSNKSQF